MVQVHPVPAGDRWRLYRLLSDPVRLRVLALTEHDELAMGELAELLGEALPNITRHVAPLRQASLVSVRRQGTRVLARVRRGAESDAVVADALATGRRLCKAEGSLDRVEAVVAARDAQAREYFAATSGSKDELGVAAELPAYLTVLGRIAGERGVAVDAGTGSGAVLDALAPLYEQVVALDRSEARIEHARRRVTARGYENVRLVVGEVDGREVNSALGRRADLVVGARMLHHATRPRATLAALARLARAGGSVVVLDYVAYDDETFRDRQADVWMGFEDVELLDLARAVGLASAEVVQIPRGCTGNGPDAHLKWHALVARVAE